MDPLQVSAPGSPINRRGVKRGFHSVSSSSSPQLPQQQRKWAKHCGCRDGRCHADSFDSDGDDNFDEQLITFAKHYQYLQRPMPIAPRLSSSTRTQQRGHPGGNQGDALEVSSLNSQGETQPALLLHMLMGF
ncbi:hypothetical protein FI667_g9083, partial [Globisporangium splendens]